MHSNSKECVAMLLAGGQGTRLQALTEHIAKPAVTFGGKFRIIDFTLSNCANSGIKTVGVLTQYQPLLLNRYIGSGQPWDMDRLSGGVYILPPYSRAGGASWYSGTANAVYQNILFIESYNPKYVLVLSGDHIYKMDYGKMLDRHKQAGAACTIAVIEVPLKDANQFGIMNTGIGDRIVEFEEKPKQPKSNTASMGVYIFTWDILRKYLENDIKDPDSSNDFGKNIIPNMLGDGQRMYAYRHDGYWRDVGTLESLWHANMDMIDDINLGKPGWQILSRTAAKPPHYIGRMGSVKHSLVTEGCEVYGTVTDSVLSHSVIVEEGAVVSNSVIMANAIVRRGAVVEYSILDEGSCICEGASVGGPRETGSPITVIAREESVERGAQASGDIILKDLA